MVKVILTRAVGEEPITDVEIGPEDSMATLRNRLGLTAVTAMKGVARLRTSKPLLEQGVEDGTVLHLKPEVRSAKSQAAWRVNTGRTKRCIAHTLHKQTQCVVSSAANAVQKTVEEDGKKTREKVEDDGDKTRREAAENLKTVLAAVNARRAETVELVPDMKVLIANMSSKSTVVRVLNAVINTLGGDSSGTKTQKVIWLADKVPDPVELARILEEQTIAADSLAKPKRKARRKTMSSKSVEEEVDAHADREKYDRYWEKFKVGAGGAAQADEEEVPPHKKATTDNGDAAAAPQTAHAQEAPTNYEAAAKAREAKHATVKAKAKARRDATAKAKANEKAATESPTFSCQCGVFASNRKSSYTRHVGACTARARNDRRSSGGSK